MGNEPIERLWQQWGDLLMCVACAAPLQRTWLGSSCGACGHPMPTRGSAIVQLADTEAVATLLDSADAQAMDQGYRTPSPWKSRIRKVITSEYFPGRAWREARASVLAAQRLLVIGSGTTQYPRAIHLDLDDYPGVDLVADAHRLPLITDGLDAVMAEVVLEHVARPDQVIAEVYRVLKPGGSCFFTVPFLFPYHGHPRDYRRWSPDGIRQDFDKFSSLSCGIHAGPCSAMVNLLTEQVYVMSGCRFPRGYTAIKGLATCVLFPLKFLDVLVTRFPEAHRMASTLYVHAVK
ncbi:MAG: methyltransferase domain-containing protein [Acidobacteria bacterium]|nr:methyltransferase domain-containing protein [Acidobacteriota bacterium]